MKKSIAPATFGFPLPVYMVGTYDKNGVPNVMAASWAGICNSQPPCIAVSVRKNRYTYQNIVDTECFTMAVPPTELVAEADYLGVYSGKSHNKLEHLNLNSEPHSELNCPIVEEFPLTLVCKLKHTLDLGSHTQFIGEIIDILIDESLLENDKPNFDLLDSFSYDYTNKSYRRIGEKISKAYIKHK